MDLKGINWVGDFYQKFEDMCLEVEETMYEDTVKYVENQAQTVGASMKKFYTDVLQDLLPPDSEKGTGSRRSEEQHTNLGINLKPKVTMKDLKVHDKESLKIPRANSLDLPPAFLCHVDNLFPLYQGDSARGVPGQHIRGGLLKKSDLGINKSYRKDKTCHDVVHGLTNSSTRKRSAINHEASFDHQARLTTSGSGHDPIQERKSENAELKVFVPADRADTVESKSREQFDAGNPSSDKTRAELEGNCTSDAADAFSGKTSALSWKFAYTEDYASSSGRPSNWGIDMIVDDGSTDQEPENYRHHIKLENCSVDREMEFDQKFEQVSLEEKPIDSEDEFDFVSHIEGKGSPPYKTRFRDVFVSRRRSLRKQQQDKVAVLAAAGVTTTSSSTTPPAGLPLSDPATSSPEASSTGPTAHPYSTTSDGAALLIIILLLPHALFNSSAEELEIGRASGLIASDSSSGLQGSSGGGGEAASVSNPSVSSSTSEDPEKSTGSGGKPPEIPSVAAASRSRRCVRRTRMKLAVPGKG
ncbi:hypothetical protein LINPERPRIM_LOCUS3200 [Linum perenne]